VPVSVPVPVPVSVSVVSGIGSLGDSMQSDKRFYHNWNREKWKLRDAGNQRFPSTVQYLKYEGRAIRLIH
jgi:hypothetical protein